MTGFIKINNTDIFLSGSYGSDGLIKSVPMEVYSFGVKLPQELYEAWKNGGGWNSCGSEAPSIREWAINHVMTPQQRAAMKRRYDYKR